jgi:hypothetical protein
MKKLLLVVGLLVAKCVSAQILPMQASVQNPTLQQEVQKQVLAPGSSILKAGITNYKTIRPIRKSTYSPFGWMSSHSFAENYAGADNLVWQGEEIDLFPDSLVVPKATYYTAADTVDACNAIFHKVGGVFDPYSYAFSSNFDKMLGRVEEETDTGYYFGILTECEYYLYDYRIDTIGICMDYKMGAEKDSALLGHQVVPDTVRVYMVQYNLYAGLDDRDDFTSYTYAENSDYQGVRFLLPKINYLKDPSTQKGSVSVPQSASLQTFDYILDPNGADSTMNNLDHASYKTRLLPVYYEVKAGHVVVIMYEYLPGYDYALNDTLSAIYYNDETEETIKKEQFKSTFSVPVANYKDNNDESIFEWSLDMGEGVNGKLIEDLDSRYYMQESENWQGRYVHYYYANPFYYFCVSLGDDTYIHYIDDIKEADALQVSVYPNPAQDKINVNLSNDEQAIATLYNIVGQQVNTYNLEGANNVLDLSGVASGIYMLKVQQGDKTNTVKVTVK